jgi:hypothetical protein
MKLLKFTSGLLLAGALLVLPTKAQASSVFLAGGLLGPTGIPTAFVGVGSGTSFSATVFSNVYSTSSAGYATYATNLGGVPVGDLIYAYIITNVAQIPIDDFLSHFSVKSGTLIDKVGFDPTAGGQKPSTVGTDGTVPDSAQFNFVGTAFHISQGQSSTVLLFATTGLPVLQNGSLSDGATDTELVVSATGPLLQGTPLPLPTSACAGAALLGLLSMGRRRKAKIA